MLLMVPLAHCLVLSKPEGKFKDFSSGPRALVRPDQSQVMALLEMPPAMNSHMHQSRQSRL